MNNSKFIIIVTLNVFLSLAYLRITSDGWPESGLYDLSDDEEPQTSSPLTVTRLGNSRVFPGLVHKAPQSPRATRGAQNSGRQEGPISPGSQSTRSLGDWDELAEEIMHLESESPASPKSSEWEDLASNYHSSTGIPIMQKADRNDEFIKIKYDFGFLNLLRETMNFDVDPCSDFYSFACGSSKRSPLLEMELPIREKFLDSLLNRKSSTLSQISSSSQQNNNINLLRSFYNLCRTRGESDINISKQIMASILGNLAPFPMLNTHSPYSMPILLSWPDLIGSLRSAGMNHNIFFNIDLGASSRSDDSKNIIRLGQIKQFFDTSNLEASRDELLNLVKMIAPKLNKDLVSMMIKNVLDFGASLHQSYRVPSSENAEQSMNIRELESSFKNVPWRVLLSNVFEKELESSDQVIISDVQFVERFDILLEDVNSEVLVNYIMLKALKELSEIARSSLSGKELDCLKVLRRELPFALASEYEKIHLPERLIRKISDMTHRIALAASDSIRESSWMSPQSKLAALDKLEEMRLKVGLDFDERLTQVLYKNLVINQSKSFVENILSIRKSEVDFKFSRLHLKSGPNGPFDLDLWRADTMKPEVRLIHEANTLNIMSAFMSGNGDNYLFHEKQPAFMSFAISGVLIGKAIGEAFSDRGRGYDGTGRVNNWWDEPTTRRFNERIGVCQRQSLMDGVFYIDTVKFHNTQAGVKFAYEAHDKWTQKYGLEGQVNIRGHGFNDKQLFWILAASGMCLFNSDSFPGESSLPSNTVNGVLKNMKQFARDFECKPDSKMINPITIGRDEQCSLW